MSEAARKEYLFVPPSTSSSWRYEPPERAGYYWVLPRVEPGAAEPAAPELVRWDPAAGIALANRRLLPPGADAPVAPERVRSWWPVPVVPPPAM